MLLKYGDCSLSGVKIDGPFKHIGHKEFHCPKSFCAVSVYFPVDYESTKGKSH